MSEQRARDAQIESDVQKTLAPAEDELDRLGRLYQRAWQDEKDCFVREWSILKDYGTHSEHYQNARVESLRASERVRATLEAYSEAVMRHLTPSYQKAS